MKFEYKVVEARCNEVEAVLNRAGSSGWELIQVIPRGLTYELYFKRH